MLLLESSICLAPHLWKRSFPCLVLTRILKWYWSCQQLSVGSRDMLFILSLLSWLGSFNLPLPAVNDGQLTPSAWQSPPLLTWPRMPVPCCIPCNCSNQSSLLAGNVLFPAEGPIPAPCNFLGSCWSTVRECWNIATFYFSTHVFS